MKLRALLAALAMLVCLVPAAARELQLEVIPLRHRLVRDVIPQLQPLLAPDGTLTGNASQLIVRTTPENLEDIHAALVALDVAATRLVVSVSQVRTGGEAGSSVGARVHYETTGNAAGPGSLALDADLTSTRRGDTNEVLQSVLVLDGQSALIDIGQRSPVPFILGYGLRADGPVAQIGMNYQTVSTGFYVTPQVFGENVELALNAQLQQGDPTTAVQGNSTAVSVRGSLGSWIQVGSSVQQTGTVGAGQSVGASDYQLWVKVDRAP